LRLRRSARRLIRTASQPQREAYSQNASHSEYTIVEASHILKVSPSTIYRRIKAGKYQTISGPDTSVKVLLPRIESHFEIDASQNIAFDSQCEADASHNSASYNHSETLAKAVIEMSQKLEAANYRVGWLESQLQERDKEIKLLTDSQHKPSRWARFKKWFFGR
jgi:hypothetical protein